MTAPTATPLVVSIGALLALSACGSGGSAGSTGSTDTQVALAQCMHSHGVPNFPDPTRGPGEAEGFSVSESTIGGPVTIDGTTFSGPAFESASKACGFTGPGHATPLTEAQKQAFVAKARCIRQHGVPNFPDPTLGPGGPRGGHQPWPRTDRRFPGRTWKRPGRAKGSAPGSQGRRLERDARSRRRSKHAKSPDQETDRCRPRPRGGGGDRADRGVQPGPLVFERAGECPVNRRARRRVERAPSRPTPNRAPSAMPTPRPSTTGSAGLIRRHLRPRPRAADQARPHAVQNRRRAGDADEGRHPGLPRSVGRRHARPGHPGAQQESHRPRIQPRRDRGRRRLAAGDHRRRRGPPGLPRPDRDGHPLAGAGRLPARSAARIDARRDARRRPRRTDQCGEPTRRLPRSQLGTTEFVDLTTGTTTTPQTTTPQTRQPPKGHGPGQRQPQPCLSKTAKGGSKPKRNCPGGNPSLRALIALLKAEIAELKAEKSPSKSTAPSGSTGSGGGNSGGGSSGGGNSGGGSSGGGNSWRRKLLERRRELRRRKLRRGRPAAGAPAVAAARAGWRELDGGPRNDLDPAGGHR